jgi:hypothetical protein
MTSVETTPTALRRLSSRVPRDVLLLVAGALLALAVEEVRDARHRRSRATESINSIRDELRSNIALVTKSQSHHEYLVDTLTKLATGRQFPVKQLYLNGMFNPARVTNVAWLLARESGALTDVPLAVVLKVASAYDSQDRYRLLTDAMATGILDQARRDGIDVTLRDHFTQFIPLDTDFKNREGYLLETYRDALKELDRVK